MTTTVMVDPLTGGTNAPVSAPLAGTGTNLQAPGVAQGPLPTAIPLGQVYYWTAAWQAGEAETAMDRQRGDTVVLADADAAIRWLLSSSD